MEPDEHRAGAGGVSFGSSKRMTAADKARMVAIKELGCVVSIAQGAPYKIDCDVHHLKSGNIRRGHQFTVGLSVWHHRGVPFEFHTHDECRRLYGPSLAEGVKPFREHLRQIGISDGSDDALLAYQNRLLKWLAEQ